MLDLIFRTVFLAVVFACGANAFASDELSTQTSSQSAVTVKVTPHNLQAAVWEFDVVFDTHSQELRDDLMKEAVLVTAGGAQASPVDWKGDPPGGHHRKGILRFNALNPAPDKVVLLISRPGEKEPRTFQWNQK